MIGLPLVLVGSLVLVAGCAPASDEPATAPSPVDPAPSPDTADDSPARPPSHPEGPSAGSKAGIDDPESLSVVVNKRRPLNPWAFVPSDLVSTPVRHANPPTLRRAAADALVAMFAAAKAEGAGEMQVQSAYRSYDTQVSVYNGWVKSLGQVKADLQSARPGTSEHQTGLSADISAFPASCSLQACFADTAQGRWLATNAHRFGFVLRFPAGATGITGYTFEPWHYRYVGTTVSGEMRRRGVATLEEFYGLPPAPTY